MALAQQLREARKAVGLTLEKLAEESGVSKTYLWELENDPDGSKKPSADVLLKLASALKTTLADLLELPFVAVNQSRIDVSRSLEEFREFMARIGEPLTDAEFRDLASMRFRGGQPKTKDDWHDLYRTLRRTTRK